MPVTVSIQRLPHGADLLLPAYATAQSAGLDLLAAVASDRILPPGQRDLVPTGTPFSVARWAWQQSSTMASW